MQRFQRCLRIVVESVLNYLFLLTLKLWIDNAEIKVLSIKAKLKFQ